MTLRAHVDKQHTKNLTKLSLLPRTKCRFRIRMFRRSTVFWWTTRLMSSIKQSPSRGRSGRCLA